MRRSTSMRLPTQRILDSGKVRGLSFADNLNSGSTSVFEIMRPFYNEGILFLKPFIILPLEKEDGEVIMSHGANDDSSNL